jgi:hypothetical protein
MRSVVATTVPKVTAFSMPFPDTTQRSNTMIRVSLPLTDFDRICHENHIVARDVPALEAWVYKGIAPSATLLHKVRKVANYVAWFHAMLKELSKGVEHQFPPPNYQVPAGYQLYAA